MTTRVIPEAYEAALANPQGAKMIRKAVVAVALAFLTACGTTQPKAAATHSSTQAPASPTSAAATQPAGITCDQFSSDLGTVLSDLKTEDAREQEAWVTGGDDSDLQALISDTNGVSGSDKLSTDAQAFNSDATGYLNDQSPYLAPGWETEYHQVRDDINAMATDCGMKPVLASPGTS